MVTVEQLATKLGAQYVGPGDKVITGIKPLHLAGTSDLSFYAPSTKRNQRDFADQLANCRAGALLVQNVIPELSISQIVVAKPMEAIIGLAGLFYRKPVPQPGIAPTAIVAATAKLDDSVTVGAYSVIGENVEIGANTIIYPHVVIYDGAKIGESCVIHSFACIRECVVLGNDCLIQNGVVVGGDGFGYIPDKNVGHRRIPHIGTTVLGDHVDLGANATVDRATLGETRVGRGTKIDNLVMVGHNVQIGEASLLCSQVGVSGSSTVGDHVILAGQVGVADHLHIGNHVRASARTGIVTNVEDNIDIAGHPNVPIQQWRRQSVVIKQLPEVLGRLRKLETKGPKND